jgi:hypothetical protein
MIVFEVAVYRKGGYYHSLIQFRSEADYAAYPKDQEMTYLPRGWVSADPVYVSEVQTKGYAQMELLI